MSQEFLDIFDSFKVFAVCFKGNAQFVEKVTFEPLMDLEKRHFGSFGIITKAGSFKSFIHLSY